MLSGLTFWRRRPFCFLSHDAIDKPQVRAVGLALTQRGARVWLDTYDLVPGPQGWWDQIEDALKRASHVIIFLSQASCTRLMEATSTVFSREIAAANRLKKVVLVVMLGDVASRLPDLSSRLGCELHTKHAIAMFEGEKLRLADRSIASAGTHPERAFEVLARHLRLSGASPAIVSLENDLFAMMEDIRAIRYGQRLVERFQASPARRKQLFDTMAEGYRSWSGLNAQANADLAALVREVRVPPSLVAKESSRSLSSWVMSELTHKELQGPVRVLWNFCFSYYGLPDPSGEDVTPRLNQTKDIQDFDLTVRADQAKLFDDIGWALERKEAFDENLGITRSHDVLVRLLVFVEIARITMNRGDDGPGKMGLVYLDRHLSRARAV